MANRTRLQIQVQILIRVRVQEPSHMIDRLQLSVFGMAERAAIRRLDRVVAHQAVGHLRKIRAAHRVGRLYPPMTRETRVGAVQVLANVTGGR